MTDRVDGLSGYLSEIFVSGGGLEFGGAEVAEGGVQAGAVVPADVLRRPPGWLRFLFSGQAESESGVAAVGHTTR